MAVPVPGLLNEIYISAGRTHGVREGDYFLAYNPNIRAIAVLKVTAPQERMSVVTPYALFASLRKGDRVRRISPLNAQSLRRQGDAIAEIAPPLSSTVLVERDMQAIADSIGSPLVPPAVPPPVLAAPAGRPAMPGIGLTAKAAGTGMAPAATAPTPGKLKPSSAPETFPPAPVPPVPGMAPPAAAPTPGKLRPASEEPAPVPPVPASPVPPVPPVPAGAAPAPRDAAPLPAAPLPAAPTPPAPPAPDATKAPEPEAAATPPAPGKVSASLEGSTVVVKWNPVSSKTPLAGYQIYRAYPGDEQGAPVNTSPVRETFYRDRSPQEGRTYMYWVVAQTVEGKVSVPSTKVKVDVPKAGGVVPFF